MYRIVGICLLLLALGSCIDPFNPPEITNAQSYLVVDGFLNVDSSVNEIRLSRTVNLTEKVSSKPELHAQVSVQSSTGNAYPLAEVGEGVYRLSTPLTNAIEQYRLYIRTSENKEYLSDLTEVKRSPAIDELTYQIQNEKDGVQIFLSTHDPENRTHFYRWKFEETWEYTSALYSGYEVVGNQVEFRKTDIYTCWKTEKPSSILLASSIKLSQDRIENMRITFIPIVTKKLLRKYSILVKQYALTREAFDYWTALSKTTESTGSLFDPLPSQVTGNIHAADNASEPVFGFFSVGTIVQKRIFINERLGLPEFCDYTDTLEMEDYLKTPNALVTPIGNSWLPDEFIVADVRCVDCRLKGGILTKPDFW